MLDLTPEEYKELPVGYCYESHVEINQDVYETHPMTVVEAQCQIINRVLSLITDDPEEDEFITCNQTESCLQYHYKGDLVMELDSMFQVHHQRVVFNYRVYGID